MVTPGSYLYSNVCLRYLQDSCKNRQ